MFCSTRTPDWLGSIWFPPTWSHMLLPSVVGLEEVPAECRGRLYHLSMEGSTLHCILWSFLASRSISAIWLVITVTLSTLVADFSVLWSCSSLSFSYSSWMRLYSLLWPYTLSIVTCHTTAYGIDSFFLSRWYSCFPVEALVAILSHL
jgi:hypothetical protein